MTKKKKSKIYKVRLWEVCHKCLGRLTFEIDGKKGRVYCTKCKLQQKRTPTNLTIKGAKWEKMKKAS